MSAVLLLVALAVGAVPASAQGGDPLRPEQWGHDLLRVERAWATTRGGGATVAVVDTGVALDHPDLIDRFVRRDDGSILGLDLVDGGSPTDTHGHGTLVAGIVAATAGNGEGIAGVAPRARILPIRVLDGTGNGVAGDVDRAIRWAVDNGADVINLSLEAVVAEGRSGPAVPAAAIDHATSRGVVVVIAAGNTAGSAAAYPEDTPALLVGAVGRDGRPALVDVGRPDAVLAPGVDVVSTWCRRTRTGCDVAAAPYGFAEGTSFAAPHVSGVAAMLVARGLSGPEVVERLRDTAVPVDEGAAGGAGRVDAAAAVAGPDARPARAAPRPQEAAPEPEPAPAPEVVMVREPEPTPPPRVEPPPAPTPEPPAPPAPEPPPEPEPEVVPEPEPEPEPAQDPAPDPEPDPDPDPDPAVRLPVTSVDDDVVAIGSPPVGGALSPQALAAASLLVLTMGMWSLAARRWDVG